MVKWKIYEGRILDSVLYRSDPVTELQSVLTPKVIKSAAFHHASCRHDRGHSATEGSKRAT
jgi:hypothetical protein